MGIATAGAHHLRLVPLTQRQTVESVWLGLTGLGARLFGYFYCLVTQKSQAITARPPH